MKNMQCKKLLLCCGISMLALFGMYGCSAKDGTGAGDANTGNANTGSSTAGETENAGTGSTTAGDTATENTVAGNTTAGNANNETTDGSNSQAGNEKVEKSVQSEYAIGDVKDLEIFEIDHEAGNVTIGVSGDENINVKATSNITSYSEEELNGIVENIDIVSRVIDNKCILRAVNKTEGTELWDWLEKEQKEKNVSIDLEILLPKHFLSYEISVDEGNLYLSGLEGNMDLETDKGDIKVDLVENLNKNTMIEIEADKGNIEVNLKKNPVEYMISEANHTKAKLNKVCDLEVSADSGSVTIIE